MQKEKRKVFGLTYSDENIKNKLLDLQYSLWQQTKKKHTMEAVLKILVDNYQK